MRQISREMIKGNLKGEIAPFSVSLKSGGEEIQGAALVYVPNLVEKVFAECHWSHVTIDN